MPLALTGTEFVPVRGNPGNIEQINTWGSSKFPSQLLTASLIVGVWTLPNGSDPRTQHSRTPRG
jgi:hypothetical protein